MTSNRSNEANFLAAWRHGVMIVGVELFGQGTLDAVALATDKNQLRPRWDAIERQFPKLSRGEKHLLAHMLTFFNPDKIGWPYTKLVCKLPSPTLGEASSALDEEGREVLSALLTSYCGW